MRAGTISSPVNSDKTGVRLYLALIARRFTILTRLMADKMMIARMSAGARRPQSKVEKVRASQDRLARLMFFLAIGSGLFIVWIILRYAVAASTFSRLPDWAVDSLGLGTGAAAITLAVLWGLILWHKRFMAVQRRQSLTLEQLHNLSPREFEHHVADLFEQRGYLVTVRGRSGDLGVDLELVGSDGRRAIVQCKRYRHAIGPDIVRELFGTMVHEMAVHGFLVTTADISDAARDWARGKPISLIDGSTLVQLTSSPIGNSPIG
jgi:HJR/Mrr/RecB family endonuclease